MHKRTLIYDNDIGHQLIPDAERTALTQLGVTIASDPKKATELLNSCDYYIVIMASQELTPEVENFLSICHKRLGFLRDYHILVSTDPDPKFQGLAYELGLRNFWSGTNIPAKLNNWIREKSALLRDPESVDSQLFQLGLALAKGELGRVDPLIAKLQDEATVDYRVSFSLGKASELKQKLEEAEKFLQQSQGLNPRFIPGSMSLGLVLLQNGKPDKAMEVLGKLEKINDKNAERKGLLAAAAADKGDWEAAQRYLNEASALDADNPKLQEMRVRVAFKAGDVANALALLDKCGTTDEYFLAKLNEVAIELSKSGRIQEALTLYTKAHDHAPLHCRFKISFNISLAYKRHNDLKRAAEYADKVELECLSYLSQTTYLNPQERAQVDQVVQKAVRLKQQIKEAASKA